MNITILSLGQPSAAYIQKGEGIYLKRLSAFGSCQLEILSTKKINATNPDIIKKKESELILAKIEKSNAFLILLDERGKEITSKGMAKMIDDIQTYQRQDVIFLIGGAYGVDDIIKKKADKRISLSKLTLPHQLVRLLFLEQLYRAFSILKGLPYHHD